MKVAFTDFDGVLNSSKYLREFRDPVTGYLVEVPPDERLDVVNVARLNRLVEATKAYVVVTSTWRHGKSRTALQEALMKKGFKGRVLGKTEDHPPRCFEISNWILDYRNHDERLGTLDAWVILDDERVGGGHEAFTVYTSPEDGLSDADVDRAIAILNGDSK